MGIQLSILNLGTIDIDHNLIVSGHRVATREDPQCSNSILKIPVQAFLIRSEGKNILFDTGCNEKAMGCNGRWPDKYQKQVDHKRTDEETMLHQLEKFQLTPDDIDYVILSHMHNDHAGSVELFQKAEIFVHREEFHACLEAYATYDMMSSYIWADTHTWLSQKMHWNFIDDNEPDFRIMPGVRILNLGPGHTRGDLALMISLEKYGTVILAADAIYRDENIHPKLTEPGVVYDTVGWRKSATRLLRLAQENNAEIWFGHDMEQFQKLLRRETFC